MITRNTLSSLALTVVILLMGACNSDTWDELPAPISQFISEYFPFGSLSSYSETSSSEVVNIRNGATLTFDRNYAWTDVNGNGSTLPEQFLLDSLPADLYSYILSSSQLNGVYRVTRTTSVITVTLLNTQLTYPLPDGPVSES